MGQAKRKLIAAGGVTPIRPEREKLSLRIGAKAFTLLREGHERLTTAQAERNLPTVSWDLFLEHLMMAGLERLGQQMAAKPAAPPPEKNLIVTPDQASREIDGIKQQRRTLGRPYLA